MVTSDMLLDYKFTCFPYVFSFQLVSDSAGPFIRYVQPTYGDGLNPLNFVEIRFSESIYNRNGNPITRNERTATLGVTLVDFNTLLHSIYPSSTSQNFLRPNLRIGLSGAITKMIICYIFPRKCYKEE